MSKDIILNHLLSKPLTIEIAISELIGVSDDEIRQVAKASNGQFIKDRSSMPALEFLTKYFPTCQLTVTSYDDIIEHRAPVTGAKSKAGVKKQKNAVVQNAFGQYVLALYESGNEFAATYRKLDHAKAHFDFSMNTMTYKKDGRRFTLISNHGTRVDAISSKQQLISEMEAKGKFQLIGVLPV